MLRTHSNLPLALQTLHFHLSRTVNNHITVTYNAQCMSFYCHWMATLLHRNPTSIGKSHESNGAQDKNKTDAEYYKKTHMMFPYISAACRPSWKTLSVCQVLPAVYNQTSFRDWCCCIRMRCINKLWPDCVSSSFENKRLVKRKFWLSHFIHSNPVHEPCFSFSQKSKWTSSFLSNWGKAAKGKCKILQIVCGNKALSQTYVFKWFKRLRVGCQDHVDDINSELLSTVQKWETTGKFWKLVARDHQMTLKLMEDQLNINREWSILKW